MWFTDYQQGEGTMYYYNGDVYIGNWFQDKRSGKGTYTWKAGAKYEGEWKEDKKNGQGVMVWPDQSKYEGEWKDDARDGRGRFTMSTVTSMWVTGRMTCSMVKAFITFIAVTVTKVTT